MQVNDKTEVGLTTTYNFQTSNVALGLAGKYTLEDGAQMKVRKTRLGIRLAHYEVVTCVTSLISIFTMLFERIRTSGRQVKLYGLKTRRLFRVILSLCMFLKCKL